VAQKRLLHHHRAPTHGVVAQRTAITPIGDGALMAQWRTAGSPILLASRHMRERAATKNMSLKRIQKLSRVNEVRIAYLFISDFKRGEGLDRSD
jgi:hypothetical protein